jgi:hypothetical protein
MRRVVACAASLREGKSPMQSRKITALLALVVVAVAVALFIVLSGGSDSEGGANRSFNLEFAHDKAVGGAQDISATQGDHLTVSLMTDEPAELHIHGYELSKDVDAGSTGSIKFTADTTGEFEVEAHPVVHGEEGEGVELAMLQVNP